MKLPKDPKERLKYTHTVGWKGLIRVYPLKTFLRSLWVPLFLTILVYLLYFLVDEDPYLIITKIIDIVFNLVPNLLGFILAGYAIIISFGNKSFLRLISDITYDNPISYFQEFSSIFSFCLISLAMTLVFSLGFYFLSIPNNPFNIPSYYLNIINHFGLVVLLFLCIYSVLQIPTLVINVFTLSQVSHMNILSELENLENTNEKNNTSEKED